MSIAQFGIGVTSLKRFAADLNRADKEMAKNLRGRLKAAAEIVASRMRSDTAWSSRIPGSIRTVSTARSAAVRVGGARAPEAAPLDNRGQDGTFRHPVFGRNVWVDQPARPFALKALKDSADEVETVVGQILDDFARDAGFH